MRGDLDSAALPAARLIPPAADLRLLPSPVSRATDGAVRPTSPGLDGRRQDGEPLAVLVRMTFLAGVGLLLVAFGLTAWLDAATVLHLAPQNHLLDRIGALVERPGQRGVLYPVILLAAAAEAALTRRGRVLVATVSGLLLVNVVVGALKILTQRGTPRLYGPALGQPDLVGHVGEFPSGHAANIAAAATLALLLAPAASRISLPGRAGRRRDRAWRLAVRVLPPLCPVVEVTSWLRSTHWLTDLLVGGVTGAACAAAGVLIADQLESRRARRRQPAHLADG
ncbi:MAG: phosphatase PAP2 family protein [Motilibacteraceae bacterium]